ncbi:MAG: 4a-hydroxytetrahydrobiopterin dehydratase [Chloroflexi bacterium]|nr:4a-hydroxytetrahydrobiopterin dehydratase [Chloroflexota bacterium]
MKDLTEFKCVACRGDTPPLTFFEIVALLPKVPEWQLIEIDGGPRLERVFLFKNFADALTFTNRVAVIAETEDHHPHIATEWGRVTVQWWTYAIDGLHKNDFIMAAKTDLL